MVDAHTGGMIGAAIKQAGWDAMVMEGASDHPVYLNIVDDNVEIKPAGFVWGQGTRATTEMLSRKEGVEACVATIGPAGENLLPYACIINSRNHSAGAGTGAVMGSKNVKALVVRGTPARLRDRPASGGRPVRLHAARDRRLQQQPRRTFHPAGVGRVLRQGQPLDGPEAD